MVWRPILQIRYEGNIRNLGQPKLLYRKPSIFERKNVVVSTYCNFDTIFIINALFFLWIRSINISTTKCKVESTSLTLLIVINKSVNISNHINYFTSRISIFAYFVQHILSPLTKQVGVSSNRALRREFWSVNAEMTEEWWFFNNKEFHSW